MAKFPIFTVIPKRQFLLGLNIKPPVVYLALVSFQSDKKRRSIMPPLQNSIRCTLNMFAMMMMTSDRCMR